MPTLEAEAEELSFGEKLGRANWLSLQLIYERDSCEIRDLEPLFGEALCTKVHGYADGLEEKYHMKRHTGQCSLAATMAYDLAAEEARLDRDIAEFEQMLKELGLAELVEQRKEHVQDSA